MQIIIDNVLYLFVELIYSFNDFFFFFYTFKLLSLNYYFLNLNVIHNLT